MSHSFLRELPRLPRSVVGVSTSSISFRPCGITIPRSAHPWLRVCSLSLSLSPAVPDLALCSGSRAGSDSYDGEGQDREGEARATLNDLYSLLPSLSHSLPLRSVFSLVAISHDIAPHDSLASPLYDLYDLYDPASVYFSLLFRRRHLICRASPLGIDIKLLRTTNRTTQRLPLTKSESPRRRRPSQLPRRRARDGGKDRLRCGGALRDFPVRQGGLHLRIKGLSAERTNEGGRKEGPMTRIQS